MMGFNDPQCTRVYFAYKTLGSDAELFNKILCYDWVLDRWAPITGITGEHITSLAQASQTLEGLDDVTSINTTGDIVNTSPIITNIPDTTDPQMYVGMWITGTGIPASTLILSVDSGTQITMDTDATATNTTEAIALGGSLDTLGAPSLDAFPVAFGKQIAVFNSAHKLGFQSGDNLEATLETPEQGDHANQMFVSGCYPVSDAPAPFGQVSSRQNVGASRSWNVEQPRDGAGLIPARADTRYSRFRNRIAAGEVWTFSSGVMPLMRATGNR